MHVRRLTKDEVELSDLALQGVLVQVPIPYDIVAVLVGPSGDRILKKTVLSLPADDEFLEVGFRGSSFRSQELSLALHPNGAVSEYKLESVQKVSDTVQSVADATKSVNDALVEIKKAQEKPASPDPVDAENTQLRLQILNLMLKANLDAIQAGLPLPYSELLSN